MLQPLEAIQRSVFHERAQPHLREMPDGLRHQTQNAGGTRRRRPAVKRMTLDRPPRPSTAHELLDLAKENCLEFVLRVMLFDFRAGLPLDVSAKIGIVNQLPQGPVPGLRFIGDQEPRLAMPHAIGVDLDVGINARDAASAVLAELGIRLRTMKHIGGQRGQADLEAGGREAAEETVVVVDHGMMPRRGQLGRRSRTPEVRSTRGPSSSINRRRAGRKIRPSESSRRLVA